LLSSWKLSIVYDSDALQGFETGWGFSALLSSEGTKVLFDCGWDGHVLRRNLGRLGFGFSDIDMVFISHSHWDHIGGLPEVLQDSIMRDSLKVIVHKDFSKSLIKEIGRRATVLEVDGPNEFAPGLWSSGILGTETKEHALVVVSGSRGLVLTGCAHPGLRPITSRADDVATTAWLVGGFHDAPVSDIPAGCEKIIPCHCTSRKKEISSTYGQAVELGAVGRSFVFS
jgi:7,8-dihydropterin-6-yl-methyl-4-(beta-D-ribofuranosyl)aminobenzene 5'-phosphate synthase